MRFISTRAHGVIDYASGLLLILAPYLFGFANGGAAQLVPQILGVVAVAMALLTDYELGAVRLVPMPTHLVMDIAIGVLLALSPWLFGFAGFVFWPHLILGIAEIGAGLTTRTRPGDRAGTVGI